MPIEKIEFIKLSHRDTKFLFFRFYNGGPYRGVLSVMTAGSSCKLCLPATPARSSFLSN
jgi:hypothetical protein